MMETLNTDVLSRWIGRQEEVRDTVTAALVERFQATFGLQEGAPSTGRNAPRLLHVCLCHAAVSTTELGEDGHPARGGFLPPVPLPRRMWAGSRIAFNGDIQVGDEVTRSSRISDVVAKQGRTGNLCFVTVENIYRVGGVVKVTDRQSIVYREADQHTPGEAPPVALKGATVRTVDPTSAMLFRYSALTFNGHRIHYDVPYAVHVEGYPGLVVHGPLQATLLFQLAAEVAGGRQPDEFTFSSRTPVHAGDTLRLNADALCAARLSLWTCRHGGPAATQAEASWR